MLKLENLTKSFGGLLAVDHCSLEIEAGRITGLIGPNGAGKTTIFNMIAGALKPTSGKIIFEGKDITGTATHQMFHMGIVRTFQIPHEYRQADRARKPDGGAAGPGWGKPVEVGLHPWRRAQARKRGDEAGRSRAWNS